MATNSDHANKVERKERKLVIRSRAEWEKMEPPFPDESDWSRDLEADAKRRGIEEARRKIVVHTLEEMQNMDPAFPDESEWALELGTEAKRRESDALANQDSQ